MAIEIVSFPMKRWWVFHSYVKLPEGKTRKKWWFSGNRMTQNVLENGSFMRIEETEVNMSDIFD